MVGLDARHALRSRNGIRTPTPRKCASSAAILRADTSARQMSQMVLPGTQPRYFALRAAAPALTPRQRARVRLC